MYHVGSSQNGRQKILMKYKNGCIVKQTNVLKNGDYTPEEDGVECYTIKMASRMYVHWALRQQHYASQQSNAQAQHLEQFCTQQKNIAQKAIDCTYISLRDQINQQTDVYFEKERHYESRLRKMI